MFGFKIIREQKLYDLQTAINELYSLIDAQRKTLKVLESTVKKLKKENKPVLIEDISETPLKQINE